MAPSDPTRPFNSDPIECTIRYGFSIFRFRQRSVPDLDGIGRLISVGSPELGATGVASHIPWETGRRDRAPTPFYFRAKNRTALAANGHFRSSAVKLGENASKLLPNHYE
ncbi:deoxyribose-phosphate aldolase [Anopheles sinensis]|uniref:Deoxyribose-phosphate aldolase n=1 Tax=Anopheles sinensis TaxID=74873 RepID=A0A084VYY8_ANOSI|nr:deoxyribose-phosphate aldolase [Anopheles sinensis]